MYPSQPGQPGDAVDELRRIFNVYKPLIGYYEQRPRNPLSVGWREWIEAHGKTASKS
jgi:hypothetical protein